jgi:TPR repeat protein
MRSIVQRLREEADSHNPGVWHALGNACANGSGTVRDVDEAIRWYQRAAEAGYPPAMVSLAHRLRCPTPTDLPAAIQWLRKAAALNSASAMVDLGFAYREGTGVPQDYAQAIRWFSSAVEAGDKHAMIHVGRMYAGYLCDPVQAVAWFLRAADAAFPDSFIELAHLYNDRESKVYNPAEAHKWYRIVAEYSEGTNSRALLALAHQHLDGAGVPCDLAEARLWLHRLLQVVPDRSATHREATRLLKKLEGQFL